MTEHRDIGADWEAVQMAGAPRRNVIAVIGIDHYRDRPRLTNAVADARATAEVFERLGFQQVTEPLLDERATGKAIHELVTDNLRMVGPDDSLVLFYAGHGGAQTHRVGNQVIKTGYIIPVDASDRVATWIELDGWLRAVSLLPVKHILVIIDACHSGIALGPVIKWRDMGTWQSSPLSTLMARRSRRIITSALDDQTAMDSGPVFGHSLFTGCLIEGLRHGLGARGNRVTTGSELGLYLQRRVETYPNSRQTPDFGTFDFDDRGEMVIPLMPHQAAALAAPADAGIKRPMLDVRPESRLVPEISAAGAGPPPPMGTAAALQPDPVAQDGNQRNLLRIRQGEQPFSITHREVPIGTVLAGRYRIERVLGRGGMGLVVQATHLQLSQPVAMKFLLPEVLGDQQVVQRFLREAQAAVRLTSEHVARVIDVGALEAGEPYMVFEYLEGADLSNYPRSHLTLGRVINLVLQACEALAEAHSLGIVHRDIKPANLFITRRADGTLMLKVLDFGISKLPRAIGRFTATDSVMGTPTYMSPEQMHSSRDVDPRSDIWSLGIVLYELLQGAPPFDGDTFAAMVLKVTNDPVPKFSVSLPGDLDDVVYRCLDKDPAKRFQNTAELAYALARYAESETQAAISVQRTRGIVEAGSPDVAIGPAPVQRALPSTISGAAGAKAVASSRPQRWPLATVIAGSVLAVAVFAFVTSRDDEWTKSPPRPTGSVSAAGHEEVVDAAPTTEDAAPAVAASPDTPVGLAATAFPASADAGVPDGPVGIEAIDAAVPLRHETRAVPRHHASGVDRPNASQPKEAPVDRGD